MKSRLHPTPLPCVVLGVDPGKVSGWAIVRDSWLIQSDTATAHTHRAYAVEAARVAAESQGLPLVVMAERWQGGWRSDRASARTVAGIGASWGRWLAVLEGVVPKSRILRVGTSTWRAAVLGGNPARTTEGHKAAAIRWATARYHVEVTGDEAEAIAIASYGTRADAVRRVLPKRVLRAHGITA